MFTDYSYILFTGTLIFMPYQLHRWIRLSYILSYIVLFIVK